MPELVNRRGYGERDAMSLSGGEQQRVAIARALDNRPNGFFGRAAGRAGLNCARMQIELKKMQQHLGITFI